MGHEQRLWKNARSVWCILVPVLEEVLDLRDQQTTSIIEFWRNMEGQSTYAGRRWNFTWAKLQCWSVLLFDMSSVPQTRRHDTANMGGCAQLPLALIWHQLLQAWASARHLSHSSDDPARRIYCNHHNLAVTMVCKLQCVLRVTLVIIRL